MRAYLEQTGFNDFNRFGGSSFTSGQRKPPDWGGTWAEPCLCASEWVGAGVHSTTKSPRNCSGKKLNLAWILVNQEPMKSLGYGQWRNSRRVEAVCLFSRISLNKAKDPSFKTDGWASSLVAWWYRICSTMQTLLLYPGPGRSHTLSSN